MSKEITIEQNRSRRSFLGSSLKLGMVGLAAHGADKLGILRPTLRGGQTVAEAIFSLAKNHDRPPTHSNEAANNISESDQLVDYAAANNQVILELLPQGEVLQTPELLTEREMLGDGWYLEANYREIVNQLNLEQGKKDFLIFAIEHMAEVVRRGYLVNPRIGIAQTSLETGYGVHLAGKHNYFGQKPSKGDPYTMTPTQEDYGNGLEDDIQPFIDFETPLDSFLRYGIKLNELEHYDDAEACRYDDALAIRGIQNYADPSTCKIILPHGTKDKNGIIIVKSWATGKKYEEVVFDLVGDLDLGKVFTRSE